MMTSREEAVARILQPLAKLLKTPLEIDPNAGGIRRADGREPNNIERQLIGEILDLVGKSTENDARLRVLQERVTALQLENLELTAKNASLSEISARDSLTGLYNRWFVMEKIDSEMNRALRNGHPMSVLMLDLDHFKNINDSYGHPTGDAVLKSVGQVLKDSCRVYDIPGRYGGEEFCIVLPDIQVSGTERVAERIRLNLESARLPVGNDSIRVTASIGVAGMDSTPGESVLNASTLVERADRALYAAKHLGRNRVEFWAPGPVSGH